MCNSAAKRVAVGSSLRIGLTLCPREIACQELLNDYGYCLVRTKPTVVPRGTLRLRARRGARKLRVRPRAVSVPLINTGLHGISRDKCYPPRSNYMKLR